MPFPDAAHFFFNLCRSGGIETAHITEDPRWPGDALRLTSVSNLVVKTAAVSGGFGQGEAMMC